MSQQINLLNPSLIKQKNLLNPNTIVITLGILLLLMLGYYVYAEKQLSLLKTQRSQLAEELLSSQARLKQTVLLHTPHGVNKALIEEISKLERKETMQQQILQTVNQSTATPEKGYAALMRAFAKQSLDGLWLTSFSFDSRAQQLNISGRTLRGDLVPEYIARLRREPALKGKLFSALNMQLPKAEDASANKSVANDKAVANSADSAKTAKDTEINYIEFSLQSDNDKATVSLPKAATGEAS